MRNDHDERQGRSDIGERKSWLRWLCNPVTLRDICAVVIFSSPGRASESALAGEVPRQGRKTGEQHAREGEQAQSMRIIPIHAK